MSSKASATRRLMRDLREWKSCQHLAKCIAATPLDEDIFQWHVNFFPEGQLKGIIFHLVINFPHDYPEQPPRVSIKNYLKHPNVFSGWICLNMLRPYQWCRAYSVSSVLFQLLSFLIANKAPQDYGPSKWIRYSKSDIRMMLRESIQYKCECGHSYAKPNPGSQKLYESIKQKSIITNVDKPSTVAISKQEPIQNSWFGSFFTFDVQSSWLPSFLMFGNNEETHNNNDENMEETKDTNMDSTVDMKTDVKENLEPEILSVNYWDKMMNDDVEGIVIQFLNVSDLISFGRVNNRFKQLVKGFGKYIKMTRFNCWYHRIDLRYSEHLRTLKPGIDNIARNVILGYGINAEFYDNSRNEDKKNDTKSQKTRNNNKPKVNTLSIPKLPALKSCETVFHLISYDAFKNHEIKCTPTNDMTFTMWIPMYILHKRYHGKKALQMIKECTLNVFRMHSKFPTKKYHPIMAIELISSIMSSLIVTLMESIKTKKLHHSINVMDTYYHYLHLLLAVYYDNYQVLKDIIQGKCLAFISDINKRTKKIIPNLGYFMIWFLLFECPENISSCYIFKALLQEMLIRNVKWLIEKYGKSYEAQTMTNFNIRLAFKGSLVALRLFMFQYFFMVKCCDVGVVKPRDKFDELNKNLGCVSEDITRKLQIFCQKTLSRISGWRDIFRIINIGYPCEFGMKCWLRRSVFISAERRYHYYDWKNLNSTQDLKLLCHKLFFIALKCNDISVIKMLLNIKIDNDNGYDIESECEEYNYDEEEENKQTMEDDNEEFSGYSILKSTIYQYLTTKLKHNPDWDISRLNNYRQLLDEKGNSAVYVVMDSNCNDTDDDDCGKQKDMIEFLLRNNFDMTQVNKICDEIFVEAVKRNDLKTVKWCLKVEEEDEKKQEMENDTEEKHVCIDIHYDEIRYQNKIKMIRLFNECTDCDYIADRSININGRNVISIAAEKCYPKMVKLLCEQHFDINMLDSENRTAIRYAQNNRNEKNKKEMNYIIKLIKKYKKKRKVEFESIEFEIKEELYKYGGTGFDIWMENGQKPIYSNTILKCSKAFGENKEKVKDLLINIGFFEENAIQNIRFVSEIVNSNEGVKAEQKSNSEMDNSNKSKAKRRKQRRKISEKMNKYYLISVSDKMDEIYDGMYRINSGKKEDIIEIYDVIESIENAENCRLYIQNFDIVDKTTHYKLTELLLRYGQLEEDIIIGIDKQNNPYCMVHFREKNDAIGCKQARKLMFGEKVLKIAYSKEKCKRNNDRKKNSKDKLVRNKKLEK